MIEPMVLGSIRVQEIVFGDSSLIYGSDVGQLVLQDYTHQPQLYRLLSYFQVGYTSIVEVTSLFL